MQNDYIGPTDRACNNFMMVVPGAVKYGDVSGLSKINSNGLRWLDDSTPSIPEKMFIPWLLR